MSIQSISFYGEIRQSPVAVPGTDAIELTQSFDVVNDAAKQVVSLNDGYIVEFVFDNTTTKRCDKDSIHQLFPSVTNVAETLEIPQMFANTAENPASDTALKAINIFTKKPSAQPVNEVAADIPQTQPENQNNANSSNTEVTGNTTRELAKDDDDDKPGEVPVSQQPAAGLNTTNTNQKKQPKAPLQVHVSNGHLKYATFPILAGHFSGDNILHTESEIDKLLNGALAERHCIGLYPGEIGTNEIIVSGDGDLKGCIIVGMGKYDEITSFQLTKTIEQAICRYLLDVNSSLYLKNNPGEHNSITLGISSLIVGSGFGGLPVEDSIRAVLLGIQNANTKIENLQGGKLKKIEHVEFIEVYEDQALNCLYLVSKIANDTSETIKISIEKKELKQTYGSKRRIPVETSESWWSRIAVTMGATENDAMRPMQFSVYTGAARQEVKNVYISPAGIDSMISDCSTANHWTPKLATTLFEMLIPVDFKEQLKRQGNISWILDKSTAAYPWEILQDNVSGVPLSVNAGMIRQLGTMDYRLKINVVAGNNALIVGQPDLDGFLPPLPGAKNEAQAVANIIAAQSGFKSTCLVDSHASDILQELHSGYKIVHLAGHGVFNKDAPQYSGMVIGKNCYLTTADISNMSTVPELVFLNCCNLGRTDAEAELYYRNIYKIAANIGTQLIENGVKAVVAAGWAVSDPAALKFATLFYENMFAGNCFGDAITKARCAIYNDKAFSNTNTWGAYQCYGDPYYKFRNEQRPKPAPQFMIAAEAEIALDNLRSRIKDGDYCGDTVKELKQISTAVDQAGIREAVITEREAKLYADLYQYDESITKFEELLSMEQADFSVSSLEKYYNTRIKKYIADYFKAVNSNNLNDDNRQQWFTGTSTVIQQLENLLQISTTAERYSLLGSTYKRKGILCSDKIDKLQAYSKAAYYYNLANEQQSYNKAYALTNWYSLESVLVLANNRYWGNTVDIEGQQKYSLPAQENAVRNLKEFIEANYSGPSKMDYWKMIVKPNCMLCLLLVNADANDEEGWMGISNAYQEIWRQAGAESDKRAEIEHLQLMADALTLNDANAGLIKCLTDLKATLESFLKPS